MIPLIDIPPGELMESGIYPGLLPVNAPLWADGVNVVFRDGAVEKAKGYEVLVELGQKVRALAQARAETEDRIYIGTEDKVYKFSVGLTLLGSGFSSGDWIFEPWGNWLVGTNGVDPVQVWKNTGSMAPLAGTTFTTAQFLAKWGPFLLAYNTSNGPTNVEWASADDIETWAANEGNSARALPIRDLDSPIRTVVRLGEQLAIYSDNRMLLQSFVGPPNYFGVVPALEGIGAISKRSVVSVGRQNYGITRRGVFVTDGVSQEFVDPPALRKYLQDNVAWDKATLVFGYHNELQSQVIWYLPTGETGELTLAIGYNYRTRAWTRYNLIADAAVPRLVKDFPIVAYNGKVSLQDASENAGEGVPMVCNIQTKPMSGDMEEAWKQIQMIRLRIEGSATLKVGVQETHQGPLEWIHEAEALPVQYLAREGVFITLRLESNTLDTSWRWSGMQVHGDLAGGV